MENFPGMLKIQKRCGKECCGEGETDIKSFGHKLRKYRVVTMTESNKKQIGFFLRTPEIIIKPGKTLIFQTSDLQSYTIV